MRHDVSSARDTLPVDTVHTIDMPNATITCRDSGVPRAADPTETILFGHGLLFDGTMFDDQVAALRGRFRCIRPDWRGQGASVGHHSAYDMDTLTDDTLGVIEHLATGPVHYVGLSMGGYVGMRLAPRHPELLRSLTLLNTMARNESARSAIDYTAMAWIQQLTGVRPLRHLLESKLFGRGFVDTARGKRIGDEWFARLATTQQSTARRATLRRVVAGVVARDAVASQLPLITTPTLVIGAENDVATPPVEASRVAAAIPGATLHLLPGCGHSSVLEQPDTVSALLADHLGSVN